MPRALITGITGQDGYYLSRFLLDKGYEVYGLLRGQNNPRRAEVERDLPEVHVLTGDVTDPSSLWHALTISRPDEVYNLAAISFVAYSWENPYVTTQVTGTGVLNLLEAVRQFAGDEPGRVSFYQASSSEMYGTAATGRQSETTRLAPCSPYGVAKAFGHHLTVTYRESYGMRAASGILFNHESPRRGAEFVTRKITRGAARISLGAQDTITLGNVDARRDWGFAGDYVEAMWLMLQQESVDDYVVATGETHSVRELLDVAFRRVGIADWTPYVRIDPGLFRPAEIDTFDADTSKARTQLGWKPRVTFRELVTMMVDADLAEQKLLVGR
ncbi:GDP-mannose 4,6-dehydratase [Luteimicrobium xylanilyticum]|uniref:GDP-mannose 4,6-dehydratase n=1 Tax=Luteimicrobium xylanilyticum TaxID=1133546 RepID=A0A5P9QDG0_9MICO|nr:GDP-mannose 4,6-dehydratase [Luteimicrobium xylanilyticum]QFU99286.1 GDP-mannose 4,6-dehydratase [Luteimicrobium xylanilyticum]